MSTRVLITGGASGLGRALAQQYLDRGARVLISDNNAERGESTLAALTPRGQIYFQRADTTLQADWDRLAEWTRRHWSGLDILINNAGVAAAGRIDRVSQEDWDWIIDINLKGVVRGCRTFTPLFKTQGHGHIINIASLAAIANLPAMSSYNVTKAGVVSLSETLRHELAPYGIHTTVVCPGFFATNLADTLRTPEPAMETMVRKLISGGSISAEEVARRIIAAADSNRFLVLPQREGKLLWWLKKLAPRWYSYRVARGTRQLIRKLERTDDGRGGN